MRDVVEYSILDSVTPKAITSSTNANPTVITKASHGLATGDKIMIVGHATNTAANGTWLVEIVDANTFKIKDINTQAYVAGNGVGGGTGIFFTAPKILLVQDFRHIVLHLQTASSGSMTVKPYGSLGLHIADQTSHGDTPNFAATVSDSNPYGTVALANLDDNSIINGSTGIVASGTDITRELEVNTNGLKYFTMFPTAWTAGAISIRAQCYNDR